jgi:hypothetical protein
MTDPAVKHRVDALIELQIFTLRRSSSLTPSELIEYHARSAKIRELFAELDGCTPLPPYPIHKSRHRHPHSDAA